MRITLKAAGLSAALIATLALAGCVQPPPPVIPTSAPSATPVFTSDAAALEAAKTAYTGYLAASDAVAHDGGTGLNRLRSWVSNRQFERDTKSFEEMQSEGHHTIGSSSFERATLQSSVASPDGGAVVVVYLCIDISKTMLLDSNGVNVGKDRPLFIPLQVTFKSERPASAALDVDGSVPWSGADFCS
ncbi:MAG TPA: hypothetical protein VHX87_11370 [Galbitalea sp.]|jgi:hypothetical protein|nr:hypothetical protein [Galbitalea sp.]